MDWEEHSYILWNVSTVHLRDVVYLQKIIELSILALSDDAEGICFWGGSIRDVDYDIFDSM
jgi:hypothetical protein